jgi:hypothetical protein
VALFPFPLIEAESTTTGTGTYTVGAAVAGMLDDFSALADGDTCYYRAWDVDANGVPTGDGTEIGLGTVGGSGTTLARTSVIRSTNANAAVDWAAGTRRIAIVQYVEGTNVVRQAGGTAGTDEVQVEHDGTRTVITSMQGPVRLRAPNVGAEYIEVYDTSGNLFLVYHDFNGLGIRGGIHNSAVAERFVLTDQGRWICRGGYDFRHPSTSDIDAGLQRAAAGVVMVTDGSVGIGKALAAKLVEANTAGSGAPNVLTAAESRTVLTNEGTTAQNYHTLPAAAAGLEFEFVVQDTDGIRVVADTADTIRDGATVSAGAGFIQSTTVGSTLRLVAINATEWVVMSKAGTWTVDS